jgi:hypothetical protein
MAVKHKCLAETNKSGRSDRSSAGIIILPPMARGSREALAIASLGAD